MSVGTESPPMAKKKSKVTPKTGRPPLPQGPREHIFGMRGTEAYKDWLGRYAAFRRKDLVDLVDEALERMAKVDKFEPPPKR